jgi:small subunit ribosomal protein S20
MPQHQSAKKRVRQIERRRVRNADRRSMIRTAVKKVRSAEDKDIALSALKQTVSILDRMAVKGIIPTNRAANIKSKLTKFVQSK